MRSCPDGLRNRYELRELTVVTKADKFIHKFIQEIFSKSENCSLSEPTDDMSGGHSRMTFSPFVTTHL